MFDALFQRTPFVVFPSPQLHPISVQLRRDSLCLRERG